MNRAALYDRIWRDLDDAIVRGLRSHGPLPVELIPARCHVRNLCTGEQLSEALERLQAMGRIRRRTLSEPDPRSPLYDRLTFNAYEATAVRP